jgi:hypothetical protein
MIQEGEQVVPMFEETSGGACHIMIRGHLVGLKTIADSCSDWDRLFDKGMSVHVPVLEGVPQGEHAADFCEHPSSETYAIRAPAGMFEPSEGPDDMGPADLSRTFVVCVVSREHVRADDTVEDVAEDSFEHLCSSGGCQGEESHGRGHENPKPDPVSPALPARLVHVEDFLFVQSMFDFLTTWLKGLGDFLVKFAHRAKGDINSEQGLGKLLTSSSSHPVHGGEIGQQGSKPGTESGSSLGRNIRSGDCPADTFHTAQLVFGDVCFDLGNLYHLATKVIAEQSAVSIGMKGFVTTLTRFGKYLLDQVNLLSRNQVPVYPLVTRLSSRLAMPGFLPLFHFWFACRAVRRRWFRRIGRILREKGYFPLQFSHLLCEMVHRIAQLQQDLDDSVPISICDDYGFFLCHEESQYQDLPAWQGESEKHRDMTRLQLTFNSKVGPSATKMGGPTHIAR